MNGENSLKGEGCPLPNGCLGKWLPNFTYNVVTNSLIERKMERILLSATLRLVRAMNLLLHVELCQMCCVFQCDADPSSEPQVIVTAQLLNFDWLFSAIFAKAERYEPSALY